MEFDYTQRLEGKLVKLLQKDFNTPPPIGADLDASKPAPMSQKKATAWLFNEQLKFSKQCY